MSVDPTSLAASLNRLTERLDLTGTLATGRPSERLARVVAAADEVLAVDSIGILLLDENGTLRAVAASGAAATELEDAQVSLGIGPGITAFGSPHPVVIRDLRSDYGELAERLDGDGGWAVVSAPIRVGDDNVGNLNALVTRPHDWTAAEVNAVEAFAEVVATVLRLSASALAAHRPVAPDEERPDRVTEERVT